nr:tail fiber domain-containing protein [Limosilactobacillus mucosae]
MSSTSTSNDKTVADDAKVKLIIGEIGRDTKTGIIGRGYSFDNGRTFHVTDTIYGRLYDDRDIDGVWNNGMHEKVKEKVNQEITNTVEPAIKQADSAVAYANEAIEKSRVNSQAIVDINSAVSDAMSDAAVARSDGLRAWDAAQSNVDLIDQNYASASAAISSARTEAIAAADEAKASASAAQADVVAVQSDVAAVQADVTANKSDVAAAKSDIADTKTSLTSQAKSLSSYASQASAAGKDIVALKSQAGQFEQNMADTKGDVSQLKVSASSASVALSDAAGNISSLQATAKSYSAALSDAKGDIATVKATASELETKYADAAGDINQIKTDAKGMTQTISDAQGDIAKLKTRADGFDTEFASANGDISKLQTDASGTKQTLTNAKSDIAVLQSRADGFDTKYANAAGDINTLKVDASGMKQTLTDAKGDISTLQATATGFKNTLTDAQGNISTLQSDVSRLKKTTSDHAGNIATLQADAKTLTSQMSSAQGDISTLQQTASGFSSKVSGMETSLADANSKITSNGGGVNLLTGSKTMHDVWSADGTSISSADDYLVVSATGNNMRIYQNPSEDTNGKLMSVSFDAEVPADSKNQSVQIWVGPFQAGVDVTISGNAFKRYKIESWKWNSAYKAFSIHFKNANDKINIKKIKLEFGAVATPWSPAPEDTDAKITTNSAAIDQNKKAIALKADEETVNKTNETVQQLQAQLKVQSDQISAKVSSSDLDAKGYATQTYTQTQIKQASDSWNANLTSVNNSLTQSYTNLHATVDGIKSTVATKADQSEVTQLSNLVQTKVSSGDFTSTTTQLKNLINQRVQVGDVISQINQEAGGDTLIQVSNGKKSLILDAGNTIVTGKAWIPVASIADLTADQIQAGTLTGSTVHLGDSNGNTIDLGVLGTNHVGLHSSAQNGDQTYIDYNGIANSGTGYSTTISQGKITTGYMTVNGGGLIDFRSDGAGVTIDSQNIKFYNSNAVNGGIEFSGGSPLATVRDGAVGNELRVRYDRSFTLTPIKDESARICASSAAMQVGFVQSGSSTPDRQTTGLWVDGDKRHVNLGVWGADSTWARVEANTHNIHMQADKAHAWLSSDNVFHIYKDGDSSSTATKLQVDGWAWINGWVEAAGHSQHSALSTKTEIQPVDDDKMLEMINDTDLTTFLYKTDVANGDTHRHIGLIIDDVHDVAQYQTPQDFIAPNGVSRDDDNMIGALFGAVKALTKRIKTLESKVG